MQKSQPIVTYKETVTAASSQVCLAKSTNKHNRIYLSAVPLEDGLVDDIDKVGVGEYAGQIYNRGGAPKLAPLK